MRNALKIGAGLIAGLLLCALMVALPAVSGSKMTFRTVVRPNIELPVEITIAAVGDIMVHTPVLRSADAMGPGDSYDFKPTFELLTPYLSGADYAVANLETKLAGASTPYTDYPRFNSPDVLAEALAACGVDLVATANNHAMDKDWAGLVNTLDRLDEAGLAHVGTYRSAEEKAASDPLIVDIKGIKVAFINYTESVNGIKTPVEHQAYALDYLRSPSQVVEEAAAARAAGAEVVIAILHWGPEYVTKPSAEQVGLAEGDEDFAGLLASGVDVILGSHPHVVQPAVCVKQQTPEGEKNTYVVYSLGNIVSGMNSWRTLSGAIVYVHIKKTGDEVKVTGLSYLGAITEQVGEYPRLWRVAPILPGVSPPPGSQVPARWQRRLDWVWEYLTDMFYDPDNNILPLAADRLTETKE